MASGLGGVTRWIISSLSLQCILHLNVNSSSQQPKQQEIELETSKNQAKQQANKPEGNLTATAWSIKDTTKNVSSGATVADEALCAAQPKKHTVGSTVAT